MKTEENFVTMDKYAILENYIPKDWLDNISTFVPLDKVFSVGSIVSKLRDMGTVYPPPEDVFNAFKLTNFNDVKVIIIGQDPYINENEAHGLAFSVKNDKFPPSLRNIFKEIENDIYDGLYLEQIPDLTYLAKQGVLLLNTVLTVNKGISNSHSKIGWQSITNAAIQAVSEYREGVVFMLWGGEAKKLKKYINTDNHLILESGHPSPMSANRGYWFGNKHFSKCNEYLMKNNNKIIKW